jgi:hypothetical protein
MLPFDSFPSSAWERSLLKLLLRDPPGAGPERVTASFGLGGSLMAERVEPTMAGTMTWPDQKDEPLKEVKLKEGTLTFSAVRKLMGNEIPLDYKLTIDGDTLKGKGASEFGGQKQEFDIIGKREKKDK